ncbi:MAG: YgcG family protein [Brevundimonas sp.]|nr:MAG: YgcG family protein [Brevundimonas sp.]
MHPAGGRAGPVILNRPRAAGLWAVLLAAAWLFAGPTLAQSRPQFPNLTGRVVDQAQLLSPAVEAELTTKLEALETESSDQLVVVTVPDLQGYEIEDYGYQLGRAWGIGQKENDNGALLIVAPNERKVRIEVGYGLEPILTDGLSALIIQNDILPAFRDGDYEKGIVAGVDAIDDQLRLDPAEAQARALKATEESEGPPPPGALILIIIFIFVAILFISVMSQGGRRGRRRGSSWIWTSGAGGGGGGSSWSGGGGFSGGGGSFGGGGASGGW